LLSVVWGTVDTHGITRFGSTPVFKQFLIIILINIRVYFYFKSVTVVGICTDVIGIDRLGIDRIAIVRIDIFGIRDIFSGDS
jgi:hypothetical protein